MYWDEINKVIATSLSNDGYENFKRTTNYYYAIDYNVLGDLEAHKKRIDSMWDILYLNLPHEILDRLSEPEEGNPVAITYKGRLVTSDLALSISEYFSMSKVIDFTKIQNILEIGAGYGRNAYVIKKLHPHINYTILDLEQSLIISTRYLNSVLGNDSIRFITSPIDEKFDLILAIDCLHEMTVGTVSYYFNYADSNCSNFYFSCQEEYIVPFDNIKWTIKDYPVRNNWVELFLQQHRFREDYFEAFYEC